MPWWSQVTWDIARAGGFVAYGLLTLAIVTGLLHSLRWAGERWPRLVNNEVHTHLTLLSLVFTVVHVVGVALDPFTAFRLNELLVPLASHYRPLWMAFGIVALYLGIAIGLSTALRLRIGYRTWRLIHFTTFAIFVFATIHGLGTGSDSRTGWAMVIYALSTLAVGGLVTARLVVSKMVPKVRLAGAALAVMLAAGGVGWAMAGPLRAGWNAIANNGQGSGARVSVPGVATASTPATPTPLSTAFAGAYRVGSGDDGQSGGIRVEVRASLGNGATGTLDIVLVGQEAGGALAIQSSEVMIQELSPSTATYEGTIVGSSGSSLVLDMAGGSGGSAQRMLLALVLDPSTGTAHGTITPATGG